MKFKALFVGMCVSLVWLNSTSAQRQVSNNNPSVVSPATKARLSSEYGQLPLAFEANRGQSDGRVKFLARGSGYTLFLTERETILKLRPNERQTENLSSAVIKMKLAGAKTSPKIVGLDRLSGKANYLLGNDPKRWQTGIESFARVKSEAVYPGVDLIWYGNQRQIEYDFVIAPGARSEKIKMLFEGAQGLKLDGDGSLVLQLEGQELRMLKPVARQVVDGQRCAVSCDYRLDGKQVSFQLGEYDATRPLVIDPVLVYSTYIGGMGFEDAFSVAVDGEGNAYLAGSTDSADFPGPSTIQPTKAAQTEAYVMKLNPGGNAVVYATWLGGSGADVANRIVVDAVGSVVVTGNTSSPDFPLKDALQTTRNGLSDAFVARLNAAGSALLYSTYLGGSGSETGNGVALDASGNLYVMGSTDSLDFPTMNPLQAAKKGNPVYTSTNSANSWTAASSGMTALQTNDLAVDPTNPAIIYAATERGVFKTVNGGSTWAKAGSQLNITISQVLIDPTAPMTVYAFNSSLLYKSTDGGNNWAVASTIGPILSLAIAPTSPVTLYAATVNSPLKSTDGGMTWMPIPNIRPPFGGSTARIQSFTVDPTTPTTVYAGGLQAVYKTIDGGTTWIPQITGFPQGFSFTVNRVVVSRSNPMLIFALFAGNGIYRTTNGGANWESVAPPAAPSSNAVPVLAIDPINADTIYASTTVGGIFKSTNGGTNWQAANNGLNNLGVRALVIANGSPQTILAGTSTGADLFLAKLNAAGSALVYSTYLGGSDVDSSGGLVVDANGNAYLAGTTQSKDFPTANAYQGALKGFSDAFALKLNPAGTALLWATYLGGDGADSGISLAVNGAGNVFIAGITASTNFPTVNAVQPAKNPAANNTNDAFVTRFSADGSALDYSTYLGGRAFEIANGIAVDAANNAYITGFTGSTDFPLLGAVQTLMDRNPETVNNPNLTAGDAFVTRLAADGRSFVYSTFLGGGNFDQGTAIATDAMGNAYVIGSTNSTDFPLTPNPLRSTFSQREAFIAKLMISADLAVAISDEPDPVQVGGNLAYAVTVANNGPDAATSVTTAISLPQGANFVSVSSSQGTCTGNGPVNCALGNLAAGAKATINIVITPTAAGNITLQASATSATPDANTANNTASEATKVSTLPSIFGKVASGAGAGLSGVTVNLTGGQRPAITTGDDGRYQFAELAAGGNYTVAPSRQGYVFNPPNRAFNNLTSDQRGDFAAVACVFSLAPTNRSFQAVGGAGSVMVNSPDPQCPWTARSNAPWIKLDSAVNGIVSGNGSRMVGFTVDPTVGARSGTITIAEHTFTVLQEFNACATADFSTSPVYQLPQAGYFLRILAADFNKDAVLDLAAINNNPSGSENQASLLVYPGNPNGGFAAPIPAMMLQGSNASFQAFAAGDLNGDGFRDFVATGGQNQNRIFVVLSNGAGGFAPFKEYTDTLPLFAVAIGDFNGDNKPDVAFGVRSFEANVIVRLNDGAGNLGEPKAYKAGGNFPVDQVEIADVDGDNKLDIVSFAQGPEFAVYKGDGAGNFAAQPQILPAPTGDRAVGDFNGDGRPDVLFAGFNELILYLNDGTGQFGSPLRTPLSFPFITTQSGLITGDFNGDGKIDAAILPRNSTSGFDEGMLVFLSLGGGAFTSPTWYSPSLAGRGSTIQNVAVGDFNHDGLSDLALATNFSGDISRVTIITARQDNRFEAARAYPFSTSDSGMQSMPSAIAAGDLNGDGVIDLATANGSSNKVSLLFGNGRGEFGSVVALGTLAGPGSGLSDVTIRDFNRDSKNDLAVVTGSNSIEILLGDGKGGFTRSTVLTTGQTPRQVAVADFNNDGKLDLVARGQGGRFEGGLTLFLGDGNGGFTIAATDLGGNFNPFDVQFDVGDFNGDGNADLAISDRSLARRVVIVLGDGRGGFGAPKSFNTDPAYLGYAFVLATDVNQDGRSDLIFSPDYLGSLIGVQISNGDGTFAAPVQYQVGSGTRSAAIQDVNGDGIPDVIAPGQEAESLYVLSGKGDGTFAPPYIIPLPGRPYLVTPSDFNGDGSIDFAVNRISSTVGIILLNRSSCPPAGAAVATSAASYGRFNLASESIAALFGTGLAQSVQVAASVPLPTSLGGTSVRIKDSAGVERATPLFFVSPNQINFQIPPASSAGIAVLSVINGGSTVAAGTITINRVVPALFSADASGQGFASAVVLRAKADGTQSFEPVTALNAMGQIVGVPIDLGPEGDQVFLLLFGTGIRGNSGLANVSVTVGGSPVEVQYAGAQGDYVGLDQLNLKLPRSLAGRGSSMIELTVEGKAANPVKIQIK